MNIRAYMDGYMHKTAEGHFKTGAEPTEAEKPFYEREGYDKIRLPGSVTRNDVMPPYNSPDSKQAARTIASMLGLKNPEDIRKWRLNDRVAWGRADGTFLGRPRFIEEEEKSLPFYDRSNDPIIWDPDENKMPALKYDILPPGFFSKAHMGVDLKKQGLTPEQIRQWFIRKRKAGMRALPAQERAFGNTPQN